MTAIYVQVVLISMLAVLAAFLFGRFMRYPRVGEVDRDALAREAAHWDSLEDIYRAVLKRVSEIDRKQARIDAEIKRLGSVVQRMEAEFPRQTGTD